MNFSSELNSIIQPLKDEQEAKNLLGVEGFQDTSDSSNWIGTVHKAVAVWLNSEQYSSSIDDIYEYLQLFEDENYRLALTPILAFLIIQHRGIETVLKSLDDGLESIRNMPGTGLATLLDFDPENPDSDISFQTSGNGWILLTIPIILSSLVSVLQFIREVLSSADLESYKITPSYIEEHIRKYYLKWWRKYPQSKSAFDSHGFDIFHGMPRDTFES